MNKLLSARVLPYIYFMACAAFWFLMDYFNGRTFNFIALGILVLMLGQMVFKNNVLGLCVSTVSMVFSILMFFAVLSELREFRHFTNAALQLITVGTLICTSCFFMGVMIFKSHMKKVG